MQLGAGSVGFAAFGGKHNHSLGTIAALPDTILRTQGLSKDYKVEVAWGGNLTQMMDGLGNALCSVVSVSHADAGFPGSNVISGSAVHYNPNLDLDNNWWGSTYAGTMDSLVLQWTAPITYNRIVVYLHPLRPTASSFTLSRGATPGSATNAITSVIGATATKVILDLPVSITDTCLKFSALNVGSDNVLRVVAIEVYNYVDETLRSIDADGNPQVSITFKSDPNQNSTATFSEATVLLSNNDGRYTSTNTTGPLFGTAQIDNRSSLLRSGCPVRFTTTIGGSTIGSLVTRVYEGTIQNDDSAAGTMGIIYDGQNKTATVVVKGLSAKLTKTISTPAYQNRSYDYIIRDVCYRCGIADQDIVLQGFLGVPATQQFATGSGQNIINGILQVLPFSQSFETYSPWPQFNMTNPGRWKSVLDFSSIPNTNVLYSWANSTLNKLFLIQYNNTASPLSLTAYSWSPTQAGSIALQNLGTYAPPEIPAAIFTARNMAFGIITGNAHIYSWDTTQPFTTTTLVGTFDASYHTLNAFAVWDKYVFVLASNGSNVHLFVWDTTQALSTKIDLGLTTATNVMCDGTFMMISDANSFLNIWKHNGTPYTTPFTTSNVTLTPSYFLLLAYSSNQTLFLMGNVGNVSSLNIATAWTTPATVPTQLGTTNAQDFSGSALAVGTYLYTDHGANGLWVWNTALPVSYRYFLDVPSTTEVFTGNRHGNGYFFDAIDGNGTVWLQDAPGKQMLGYNIPNVTSSVVPSFTFDQADNFTEKVVISDGNPVCNRVTVILSPFNTAAALSTLWTQAAGNPFTLYTGITNQFTIPVSPSLRGSGQTMPTQRCLIPPDSLLTLQNITGGGTTTTVSVSSTTGITNGQQILLTGGTTEVATVQSFVVNTSITLVAVNGTAHTIAKWNPNGGRSVIWDDPTLSTVFNINSYTFFGYSDTCYLNVVGSIFTSLTGLTITGLTVTQSSSLNAAYDQTDATSKKLYGNKEFPLPIQSSLFVDVYQAQDILANGRVAKMYLSEMDLPLYPLLTATGTISAADSSTGIAARNMTVVQVTHNGLKTIVKAKDPMIVPVI